MIIEKKSTKSNLYLTNYYYFDKAREGFEYVLKRHKAQRKKILLPAFIGHSTREGSGIFDPVINSKIDFCFYRLNKKLEINFEFLEKLIKKNKNTMLLLVHYFGFEDARVGKIRKLANKNNVLIIEDFAHGLFTYFKHHPEDISYALLSLHKMLPLDKGGILISSKKHDDLVKSNDFFSYDLTAISAKRIENYKYLEYSLKKQKKPFFNFLKSKVDNNIPQTLPVLIKDSKLRDLFYFELNKLGFGVVSLYHELISPINIDYSNEQYVAQHILNFPIHQDIDKKMIDKMLEKFFLIEQKYKRKK